MERHSADKFVINLVLPKESESRINFRGEMNQYLGYKFGVKINGEYTELEQRTFDVATTSRIAIPYDVTLPKGNVEIEFCYDSLDQDATIGFTRTLLEVYIV